MMDVKTHLSYQAMEASCNKYLTRKWDMENYKAHRKRVQLGEVNSCKMYSWRSRLKHKKLSDFPENIDNYFATIFPYLLVASNSIEQVR